MDQQIQLDLILVSQSSLFNWFGYFNFTIWPVNTLIMNISIIKNLQAKLSEGKKQIAT